MRYQRGIIVKRTSLLLLLACVILLVGLSVGVFRQHDAASVRSPTPTSTHLLRSPTRNWASVSCGLRHTVAVQEDGTLWAWGANFHGQLGLGIASLDTSRNSPAQVGTARDWTEALLR